MRTITTDEYVELTGGDGIVVIGMGTPWCGPWRAFLPTFRSVASDMSSDTVTFRVCDLEENPVIPIVENVTHIPAVIIYRDGKRIGRHIGVMDAEELSLIVSVALLTRGLVED